MAQRPHDEITAEIALLSQLLKTVPPQNLFGESNNELIEVQIEVLAEGYEEEDVYAIWGEDGEGDFDERILDGALDAARWAYGDGNDKPSDGWKP